MHQQSPAHEGPGRRTPNDSLPGYPAALRGKRTLSETLPQVPTSTWPGALPVTATRPGDTREAGLLAPKPLRAPFGPPAAPAGSVPSDVSERFEATHGEPLGRTANA